MPIEISMPTAIQQQLPQILIVEDSPIDIRLIRWGLKKAGYGGEPIVVTDGGQALSVLRREGIFENQTLPDLVILDLNLKLFDGPEVLQFIRETPDLSRIRVAILSSSSEDVMRTKAAEADFYFSKSSLGTSYEGVASQILQALGDNGSILWHGFLEDIAERKQLEADQRFLTDLSGQLQMASGPEAIAKVATDMLVAHFGAARACMSSVSVERNEATRLSESCRKGTVPEPGGTSPLTYWAEERILGVLAAGNTVAITNTAVDPITAAFYSSAYQPQQVEATLIVSLRCEGEWVALLWLSETQPRSWTKREVGLARSAGERIWPAYQVARAVAAERAMHRKVAEGEDRLRLALQSAAIGIWEQNSTSTKALWDARAKAIFGFAPGMAINRELALSCIHPEDRGAVQNAVRAFLDPAGNGRFELEYRITTWNDRRLRHVYAHGHAFFEGEGANRKPVRSVGTLQDITERKIAEFAVKRSLEEKEAMLQEIHHRVKNNLQIIASLLSIQGSASGDKRMANQFADSERRVRSMAIIHEQLYQQNAMSSVDLAAYVTELAAQVFCSYSKSELTTCRLDVTPVRITIDQAVPCGLILNELLTNAIKYAYPEGRGEILIRLSSNEHWITLGVSDSGIGMPPDFDWDSCKSMGVLLVQTLTGQLDGELQVGASPGASFTVRFPNCSAG